MKNYWQIASLVTQNSLFTVTHALSFISFAHVLLQLVTYFANKPYHTAPLTRRGSFLKCALERYLMATWRKYLDCRTEYPRFSHHTNPGTSMACIWHWGTMRKVFAYLTQVWDKGVSPTHVIVRSRSYSISLFSYFAHFTSHSYTQH